MTSVRNVATRIARLRAHHAERLAAMEREREQERQRRQCRVHIRTIGGDRGADMIDQIIALRTREVWWGPHSGFRAEPGETVEQFASRIAYQLRVVPAAHVTVPEPASEADDMAATADIVALSSYQLRFLMEGVAAIEADGRNRRMFAYAPSYIAFSDEIEHRRPGEPSQPVPVVFVRSEAELEPMGRRDADDLFVVIEPAEAPVIVSPTGTIPVGGSLEVQQLPADARAETNVAVLPFVSVQRRAPRRISDDFVERRLGPGLWPREDGE